MQKIIFKQLLTLSLMAGRNTVLVFPELIKMVKLRRFKGGKERREEVLTILRQLPVSFDDGKSLTLHNLLISYQKELQDSTASVPIAISRLNIDPC
ncbi:hypothetical protein DDV23_04905 [Streptococcus chenjunshii]|uniref:Bacteriocin immunity protein n=2 Tax=Streptococcus chenjunshii TaxID=2173853 RepID=A0A372KM64_9STRE|nr:hypothetical protein DDV23_04905 [Streptococcus chenjunshii]